MNRYIDAERLNEEWLRLRVFGITDTLIENLKWIVDRQPTIEVSEDAISREDAVNALIAHFIPQTYTGEEVEQATKLARKIMANAPSVIPKTQIKTQNSGGIVFTQMGEATLEKHTYR